MIIREELNRQVRWVYPMLFVAAILLGLGTVLPATGVIESPWLAIPGGILFFGIFY